MPNNLFLTGSTRKGKSTLIKNSILSSLEEVGGYYVRRIYIEDKCCAFQMMEIRPDSSYELNATVQELEGLDNLIASAGKDGMWYKQLDTFEKTGVDIINRALRENKKLIVLDEVGRFEEDAQMFKNAVLNLLSSDIFVLGVLKKAAGPFLDSIRQREDIVLNDVDICTEEMVRDELKKFLKKAGLKNC